METQAASTSPNLSVSGTAVTKTNGDLAAATKTGQTASGGKPFAATLDKLLNPGTDSAEEAPAAELSLSMLMAAITPLWTQTEASVNEGKGLEQLANELLTALKPGSDETLQQLIVNDPNLQEWLAQASAVLATLETSTVTVKISADSGQTAGPSFNLPNDTIQKAEIIQAIFAQVFAAMKKDPNNPALLKLSEDFQSSLKTLIALVEASGTSGKQTGILADVSIMQTSVSILSQSVFPMQRFGWNNGKAADSLNGSQNKANVKLNADSIVQMMPGSRNLSALDAGVLIRSSQTNMVFTQSLVSTLTPSSQSELAAVFAAMTPDSPAPLVQTISQLSSAYQTLQATASLENSAEMTPDTSLESIPVQVSDTAKPATADLPAKTVSVPMNSQAFADEMSEFIMKSLKITTAEGFSEARISLVPENLGKVDVRITMQNGHLVAQFMTDTIAGKEMLDNQISQLRTALTNQGIQVDKLEITQSNNMQSNLFQGQKQQQNAQHFSHQNKNKGSDYDVVNGSFSNELEMISMTKKWIYGNSFNVTA